MLVLLAILFAFAASFGVAWTYALVLYWADRYEKEPKRLLLGMFLWGAIVAVIGSAIFSMALDAGLSLLMGSGAAHDFMSAAVIAPLVEESFKGLALILLFLFVRDEIDSLFDGIIYGALVGLGFEAVENALYLISALTEGGFGQYLLLMLIRLGLFGFTHAFFTAFTGLGLAWARLYSRRWWAWLAIPLGWMLAVFAHGFHNATVSGGVTFCWLAILSDWSGLFLLIGIAIWALRRENQWIHQYLQEEVENGLISPAHYATACSIRRRVQAVRKGRRWGRGSITAQFYTKLAELAFLKAHLHRGSGKPRHLEALNRLRHEIARLAPKAEIG